ncbi:MAG: class I SAM-dependent methyltransferase [Bacilli bacterium]|nr:class I SAM-dependent methyltransferase [Bacilli bacterium]
MFPLESFGIRKARKKLVPMISGRVLEIGSGTGSNLPYYNMDHIDELIVSDFTVKKHLRKRASLKAKVLELDVQNLPFPDHSFDYVLHTLVFCSVAEVDKGLQEIRRVLKPGGLLLFIEHVMPEGKNMKKVVNGVNPMWTKISSGCNLNRSFTDALIRNNYKIEGIDKFMKTVFIYGTARPIII